MKNAPFGMTMLTGARIKDCSWFGERVFGAGCLVQGVWYRLPGAYQFADENRVELRSTGQPRAAVPT
jgi:hypothetical protein